MQKRAHEEGSRVGVKFGRADRWGGGTGGAVRRRVEFLFAGKAAVIRKGGPCELICHVSGFRLVGVGLRPRWPGKTRGFGRRAAFAIIRPKKVTLLGVLWSSWGALWGRDFQNPVPTPFSLSPVLVIPVTLLSPDSVPFYVRNGLLGVNRLLFIPFVRDRLKTGVLELL